MNRLINAMIGLTMLVITVVGLALITAEIFESYEIGVNENTAEPICEENENEQR